MNTIQKRLRLRHQRTGFSLVEIVIALGIMSFSTVAILGLFSVGLSSVGDSETKLNAANIASELLERWKADPSSPMSDMPLPPVLNVETLPVTPPSTGKKVYIDDSGREVPIEEAKFRLEYRLWNASATESVSSTYFVRIQIILYWPAAAKTVTPENTYEVMTSVRIDSLSQTQANE